MIVFESFFNVPPFPFSSLRTVACLVLYHHVKMSCVLFVELGKLATPPLVHACGIRMHLCSYVSRTNVRCDVDVQIMPFTKTGTKTGVNIILTKETIF